VRILSSFLNRERIYQTEWMYQARERQARNNLSQAIAELS
jgi:predicted metal-dependent HD superfamily phosphohydrolase